LWRFVPQLFRMDDVDRELIKGGNAVDLAAIEPKWRSTIAEVLTRATLRIPEDVPMIASGRAGRHSEHLGHMLSEMQIVARSHPGVEW
jgi:ring-1,2-phenylacetyl-CoA epoxidase subunit PaaC